MNFKAKMIKSRANVQQPRPQLAARVYLSKKYVFRLCRYPTPLKCVQTITTCHLAHECSTISHLMRLGKPPEVVNIQSMLR